MKIEKQIETLLINVELFKFDNGNLYYRAQDKGWVTNYGRDVQGDNFIRELNKAYSEFKKEEL